MNCSNGAATTGTATTKVPKASEGFAGTLGRLMEGTGLRGTGRRNTEGTGTVATKDLGRTGGVVGKVPGTEKSDPKLKPNILEFTSVGSGEGTVTMSRTVWRFAGTGGEKETRWKGETT